MRCQWRDFPFLGIFLHFQSKNSKQNLQFKGKKSLRRVAHYSNCSIHPVRKDFKSGEFERYLSQVVQALKQNDKVVLSNFAQLMLDKINDSPGFPESILFSDELIFHFE